MELGWGSRLPNQLWTRNSRSSPLKLLQRQARPGPGAHPLDPPLDTSVFMR